MVWAMTAAVNRKARERNFIFILFFSGRINNSED
jgi:hypothetical protein